VNSGTTVALTLPGTDLLLDIDAQLRPSGQGMDIGADEVVTDPFSVWFVPAAMSATAQPGTTVTNQHYLLNSGTQSDTYSLSVSNSLWTGSVTPTVITLPSQKLTNVTVVINVPAGAANGTTNLTLVRAVSQADTNRQALAVDTTGISTNTGGAQFRYVWQGSPTPTTPYTSIETAGHDIQTVVDACAAGDTVLVYPGAYSTGGSVAPGYSLTNRVCITNAITLLSLSGPEDTQIVGAADPATTNGPSAARCLYVGASATVSGFSLMNGHTLAAGSAWQNLAGGGAGLAGGTISNCTIVGCAAQTSGGGLYAASASATWDTLIRSCFARSHGGGAYLANGAALRNGLVYDNATGTNGGGLYLATGGGAINCTVVSNSAASGGGIFVSGSADVINDIVYFNSAPANANVFKDLASVRNCCTTPDPGGTGIVTANPLFTAGGNYHLQTNSPCLDAGTAASAPDHDLDGNPRPLDGDTVPGAIPDIGCYELYSSSGDSDGDGMTDGNEVLAGTDPLDAASLFHILSISHGPPVEVTFTIVTNRLYTLVSRTNLTEGAWLTVPGQSNVMGNGGSMSLRDTNAAAASFYRVSVALP
jgi:hypothetical protein